MSSASEALATTGVSLDMLQADLEQARRQGVPGELLARTTQALTMLRQEWAALSGGSGSPEQVARLQALTTRVDAARSGFAHELSVARGDLPVRKLLWTAFALTLAGGAAWGVWKWSQRDRY